ncbi:unnamed protein product [Durusdinium trenchii]|uniref:Uncharacterized protein n=2 Tax=Durusdinium trenchii TaxID=1381693 RepID=A0ABP0MPY2_9DINO
MTSVPMRDSSTEPTSPVTSPQMIPTELPSPTEILEPTVAPTMTRPGTATAPGTLVTLAPGQGSSSGMLVHSSQMSVASPTEMPVPTELISPTDLQDAEDEMATDVPTVIRSAAEARLLRPPSSPTSVVDEPDTLEAPTLLRPVPQVSSSLHASSSLLVSGSAPPASPTELPVPTYLQSPTEEGRVKVAFWDAADAGKGLTQVMHDAVDA